MITAVADTNIYISALLFGGTCEAILGLARAGLLDLYDSPAIEREFRRILRDKFRWTDPQVRDAVLELRLITTRIHPTLHVSGVVRDAGCGRPLHSGMRRCGSRGLSDHRRQTPSPAPQAVSRHPDRLTT